MLFSGLCNFLGVMVGGTAIAFSIVRLLPVDLLINATSKSAIIMVLALLASGMAWNLSTWWLGLPVSSSHTLIGAILGIGMANSLMSGQGILGGVNWAKAGEVGLALLISPVIGFISAAILLLLARNGGSSIRNSIFLRRPTRGTPAVVDPGHPDHNLWRREPGARLERRPEGDGADHAGPDRTVTRNVRAEPSR